MRRGEVLKSEPIQQPELRLVGHGPEQAPDAIETLIEARFRDAVGSDRYRRYFGQDTRYRITGRRLDVTTGNGHLARILDRLFCIILEQTAREVLGDKPVEVRFRAADGSRTDHPAEPTVHQPGSARSLPHGRRRPTQTRGANADRRYDLDQLVVGTSNRLAHGAALRLVQEEDAHHYSPLFIHGGCGIGKTHLVKGIAARYRRLHPGHIVRYTTGEAFTNEFITAVRSGKLDRFRRTYRSVHLLCIDDAQFFANKDATQSELLHTFDALNLRGARIVLAADAPPRALGLLNEHLVSRLVSGIVAQVDQPDPELRMQIVRRLASQRGLSLDEHAERLIAGVGGLRLSNISVRELEGRLTRVEAFQRLMPGMGGGKGKGGIGVLIVRKALGLDADGRMHGRPRRPIRVDCIIKAACETLGVEPDALLGRARHKRVVLARSITAHLARRLTTLSFPEIARAMARPNHSTIVTANARIRKQIEQGQQVRLGPDFDGVTVGELCEQIAEDVLRAAEE
jgi:chromosomal replication initiator protein